MQKVAIVGTGIAGMGAAWALKGRYALTFFEREKYIGGHTNTLTIQEGGESVYIDSAFMVYNETTYPLLTKLFKELDVQTQATDMSFSVQHIASGLEFCGTGFNGLFAQRKNLFNVRFWQMLLDINRFKLESAEVLENPRFASYSLAQYIHEKKYRSDILDKFLVPMSSAVWSTPADGMLRFPIVTLVRFFTNHCFLGLNGHLKWRTCTGGSRHYRDKLIAAVNATIHTALPIVEIRRDDKGVVLSDATGKKYHFDKVIIACHADEALALLGDSTPQERELLMKFPYHNNRVTLHTDEGVMPLSRLAWSSWNYRTETSGHASTVYWMNQLQGVSKNKNYFISINDPGLIDPSKVIWKTMYSHPVYKVEGQLAQEQLPQLNKNGRVYFAGAYFRYGFHEDGLRSGIDAAEALAGERLWG